MSSILKALKRLEEDKAERLEAPVDIARDILRQPRRRRRSAPGPALALACGGVVVAAVAALFLLPEWPSARTPELLTKTAAVASNPQATPPAAASGAARLTAPSAAPEEPEVLEVRMAPPPAVGNWEPAAAPAVRTDGPSARAPAPPKMPVSPPATVKAASPPRLAVVGIAYQSDRQARLAIVNDLPVMEGTVIEGARVEEILADRVRFTREGSTFELSLGAKE